MDLFPCRVAIVDQDGDSRDVRQARVIWDPVDDETTVWWFEAGQVKAAAILPGRPTQTAPDQYRLVDETGLSLLFSLNPGDCGCGHPLKTWRPDRASRVGT